MRCLTEFMDEYFGLDVRSDEEIMKTMLAQLGLQNK